MPEDEKDWFEVACGSAASSWDGYTYQGKIAIYTALCYINNINDDQIHHYSLEIEKYEDFCIKYDENYISIHQVKSYIDKDTLSSYKAAILELLGKMLIKDVKEALLHTAVEIRDFEIKKLKTDLKGYNFSKKVDLFTHFKKQLFDEDKFDEVVKKLRVNSEKGTIPINKVIDIHDTEIKIKEELKTFYENHGGTCFQSKCIENIDYVYSNLLHKVNKLISEIHGRKVDEPILSLSEIVNILTDTTVYDLSLETVSSFLYDDLANYFEQFCQNEGLDLTEDEEKLHIWNHHINSFKTLSDEDFILLCRKIAPNVMLKKSQDINVQEYKLLMDQHGVKRILISSLFTFHHLLKDAESKQDMLVIKNKFVNHLITTITDEGRNAVSAVGRRIFENLKNDKDLLEILYEVSTYVNANIAGDYPGTITDVQMDAGGHQSKERFTLPKNIKFMNLLTAEKEFSLNE